MIGEPALPSKRMLLERKGPECLGPQVRLGYPEVPPQEGCPLQGKLPMKTRKILKTMTSPLTITLRTILILRRRMRKVSLLPAMATLKTRSYMLKPTGEPTFRTKPRSYHCGAQIWKLTAYQVGLIHLWERQTSLLECDRLVNFLAYCSHTRSSPNSSTQQTTTHSAKRLMAGPLWTLPN